MDKWKIVKNLLLCVFIILALRCRNTAESDEYFPKKDQSKVFVFQSFLDNTQKLK